MRLLFVVLLGIVSANVLAAEKVVDLKKVTYAGDVWSVDQDRQVLKPGAAGVIELAPWWGDSLRPKQGDNYVAEIEYHDDVATPVRVEVFAGLSGRYEIHRFGGLNDGQKKTIRIPLPWDMLMKIPAKGVTELVLFHPGGEKPLRISGPKILAADPQKDEAQWAAETRDWVRRVQEKKERKLPPAQTAVIPDVLKNAKIIPYVRSTANVIYPNSAPQENQAGRGLKVRMARNEIDAAQFGVFANGTDLKNVKVALPTDGFKNAKGEKLKAPVELFTAEYALNAKGNVFPQRLWPAYDVDIPAGASHMFWLTVDGVAEKAEAGMYEGRLRITADGADPAELPLQIEVLPLELLTMNEAGLHMGSCVAGLLPAHELKFLSHHNQNSINLWFSGFQFPITKKGGGDFDLDFTVADDFMKHAKDAKIENFVYFLGGDPYGFPDTLSLERELYRRAIFNGDNMMTGRIEFLKKTIAAPDKIISELRPAYVNWVRKVMAHAKEKDWPEPILTPFDEPAKWVQDPKWAARKLFYYVDQKTKSDRLPHIQLGKVEEFLVKEREAGNEPQEIGQGGAGTHIKPHFKDSCAAIKEAWPSARIYGSIHHAVPGLPFLPDIDVFCTNAIHEDLKLGDKVREGGKLFWQYSGANDSSEPAGPRYAFGFFFAAFNSRGSLCWAYNFGPRYDTTDGWIYAYTTPYNVARSPGFEGVREAWDDRRYIETLRAEAKKKGREKEAEALLTEIFESAVINRAEGGRDTVHDFWAKAKDPETLDQMREKVRAKILEIKGAK